MKRNFSYLLVAGIVACTTTPTRVATLNESLGATEAYNLISTQAAHCWQIEVTPFRKGIHLAGGQVSASLYSIRGYPIHWNIGLEHQAFITVTITQAPEGSLITVDEGASWCTVTGCRSLALVDDVKNWVRGDLTCKDIKGQLTRVGIGL
jgi:hypothetical protein